MNFKDLNIKQFYDSDEDDILNGFYIPVLSNATKYDRLAGYFSSTSLAMSAKGMAEFIRNGGKMRLVTSMQLSERDRQAVEDGISKPDDVLARTMIDEFDNADNIRCDHVAALAWMVAQGNLEIKIAVPFAKDGGFYTGALDTNSIYHQKIGVLRDGADNMMSFGGSINETGKAWTDNIENYDAFYNWKPGQDVFVANHSTKFEKFWHGRSKNTKIFNLPEAVRRRLITIAPKTVDEAVGKIQAGDATRCELRQYQKNAVNAWLENCKRGVFEMATATGKTWTAMSCIQKVLERESPILVVIACPYIHLVTQWTDELNEWNIDSESAHGSSASWETYLYNKTVLLNDGILKNLVVVTTHDTFAGTKFIDLVKTCRGRSLVVVDEVHGIGAEHSSGGLLDSYDYRLGLSATPERYFDEEGTGRIFDFFGKVVFRFELDEAIKQGYLSHYLLYPHIVYMTDDESEKYYKISRHIAIEQSKDRPDHDLLLRLLIKRANVLKTAKNKIEEFKEVIRSYKPDHCLVYCAEGHLEDAADVLHDNGVLFSRFTFRESKEEREKLLKEFALGIKDALAAIKCLDEGVDVPSTKTAIILASSRNPVEFVQRRGRILRMHENKDRAVIHDMIVVPRALPAGQDYAKSEKTIIRKEIERLEEFSSSADNPKDSQRITTMLMKQYKL